MAPNPRSMQQKLKNDPKRQKSLFQKMFKAFCDNFRSIQKSVRKFNWDIVNSSSIFVIEISFILNKNFVKKSYESNFLKLL